MVRLTTSESAFDKFISLGLIFFNFFKTFYNFGRFRKWQWGYSFPILSNLMTSVFERKEVVRVFHCRPWINYFLFFIQISLYFFKFFLLNPPVPYSKFFSESSVFFKERMRKEIVILILPGTINIILSPLWMFWL